MTTAEASGRVSQQEHIVQVTIYQLLRQTFSSILLNSNFQSNFIFQLKSGFSRPRQNLMVVDRVRVVKIAETTSFIRFTEILSPFRVEFLFLLSPIDPSPFYLSPFALSRKTDRLESSIMRESYSGRLLISRNVGGNCELGSMVN